MDKLNTAIEGDVMEMEVQRIVNDNLEIEDDENVGSYNVEMFLHDVFYGGGTVRFVSDLVDDEFFQRHRMIINRWLSYELDEPGAITLKQLFPSWVTTDPLALHTHNQYLLGEYGFKMMVRVLCIRAGIDLPDPSLQQVGRYNTVFTKGSVTSVTPPNETPTIRIQLNAHAESWGCECDELTMMSALSKLNDSLRNFCAAGWPDAATSVVYTAGDTQVIVTGFGQPASVEGARVEADVMGWIEESWLECLQEAIDESQKGT